MWVNRIALSLASLFLPLSAFAFPYQLAFPVPHNFAGIWRTGPHTGEVFEGWAIYHINGPVPEPDIQLGPAFIQTDGVIDYSTAQLIAKENAVTINAGANGYRWQMILGFDQPPSLDSFPPGMDLAFGSSFFKDGFGTSTSDFAPSYFTSLTLTPQQQLFHALWLENPPPLEHSPEPGTLFLVGGLLIFTAAIRRYYRS